MNTDVNLMEKNLNQNRNEINYRCEFKNLIKHVYVKKIILAILEYVLLSVTKVVRFRNKFGKYLENFFCIKSLVNTCDAIENISETASIDSNDEKVAHKTNLLVS